MFHVSAWQPILPQALECPNNDPLSTPPSLPRKSLGYLQWPGMRGPVQPKLAKKSSWLQGAQEAVSVLAKRQQMKKSSGLSAPSNQLEHVLQTRALSCPRVQLALEHPASLRLLLTIPMPMHPPLDHTPLSWYASLYLLPPFKGQQREITQARGTFKNRSQPLL